MPVCCVPGCGSDSRRVKGKSFHQFPFKNQDILAQWIANIDKPQWMPKSTARICSDHFAQEMFEQVGEEICLRDDAVPTVFGASNPELQTSVMAEEEEVLAVKSRVGSEIDASLTDLHLKVEQCDLDENEMESLQLVANSACQQLSESIDDTSAAVNSVNEKGAKIQPAYKNRSSSSRSTKSSQNLSEKEDAVTSDAFRQTLLRFQKENYLCDLVIEADDGQIRAHSVVMAAASSVLKSALDSQNSPVGHVIVLPGLDLDIVEVMVTFAYVGKLVVPAKYMKPDDLSKVIDVLKALNFDLSAISKKTSKSEKKPVPTAVINFESKQTDQSHGAEKQGSENEDLSVDIIGDDDVEQQTSENTAVDRNNIVSSSDQGGSSDENMGFDSEVCDDEVQSAVTTSHFSETADDDDCTVDESVNLKGKQRIKRKIKKEPGAKAEIVMDQTGVDSTDPYRRLCEKCGSVFNDGMSYASHTCKKKRLGVRVRCEVCGITCSTAHNLHRHMMLHTGERRHLCQHCGSGFIQRQSLQDHIVAHHPNVVNVDENVKTYRCRLCGETFVQSSRFRTHMLTHTGIKKGQEKFKRNFNQGEQPYVCNVCGRSFRLHASLLIHSNVHSERRVLARKVDSGVDTSGNVCRICDKQLKNALSLQVHMRMHRNEKPYICPVCDWRGYTASQLRTHVLSHTGEKPYMCSMCGKQMIHPGEIAKHMLIHTGEKPFSCEICGKQVRQQAHLSRHMLTHTGEKPFVCQICGKGYKSGTDLRFHCQRTHEISLPKQQGRRPVPIMMIRSSIPVVEQETDDIKADEDEILGQSS